MARVWGRLECICPVCSVVREVTKNSLYITKLPKDGDGRTIRKCRSCSKRHDYASWFSETAYTKDPSITRRKEQRIWGIKYLGGCCKKCALAYDGTNGFAFDFHHRDPSQKDFNTSQRRYSYEKLRAELDKCDLLCAICHRGEHAERY